MPAGRSQLLEEREFQIDEIARVFSVPVELLRSLPPTLGAACEQRDRAAADVLFSAAMLNGLKPEGGSE